MIVFGSIAVVAVALAVVKLCVDWVTGGGLPPVHELPERPLRARTDEAETSAATGGEPQDEGACAHRYAFYGSLGRRCVHCTKPAPEDTEFIWPEEPRGGGAG